MSGCIFYFFHETLILVPEDGDQHFTIMEENGEHTLQLLGAHAGGGTVQVLKLSSEEGAALFAAAESPDTRIITDGIQHSVPDLVPTQPGTS